MAEGTSISTTSTRHRVRLLGSFAVVAALVVAVFFQRSTISGALGELGALSMAIVLALLLLGAYERWSRGQIMARLLGDGVSVRSGLVVHDVGNAASKGLPMGGALGTALRWQICRCRDVAPTRFATMLVAYGIATTFATWLLPLGALLIDLTQRRPGRVDTILLAVIVGVVAVSAAFWIVVLRSDRLEAWAERRLRSIWAKLATKISALADVDPATGVAQVRRELVLIGRRPWSLLFRTLLSQGCGALILLVALRGLGVGPELGTTEFFRVFFIAHLAGTFAPTPGGVGVVEASTTGALVAAGVDATTGLAAVLVYRFVTYVIPVALGAVLYVAWRLRRRRSETEPLITESVGAPGNVVSDAAVPAPASMSVAESMPVTDPGDMVELVPRRPEPLHELLEPAGASGSVSVPWLVPTRAS